MAASTELPSGADPCGDEALHDAIKRRAYELYAHRGSVHGTLSQPGLQAELPRILYAAAEVEKYARGEGGDIRSLRAAVVYLRAFSNCLSQRAP